MFRKILHLLSATLIVVAFMITSIGFVSAEGISITSSLTSTTSVENIGKTYGITINLTPNALFYMTAFDTIVNFDSENVTPVVENGKVKITRPSKMHSEFVIEASVSGSSLIILGNDETQQNPYKLSGTTAVCTLYFTVKSTATVGKQISYSIGESTVNHMVNGVPEGITPDFSGPKTVTIGKKLDTNAYLKSITTDSGTLTPVFSQKTMKYSTEVAEEISAINITAIPVVSSSKVAVTGGKALDFGVNTINIKVTAEDSDYTKTYVILVTRISPSSATISSEIISAEDSSFESSEEDSSEIASSESESEISELTSEPSDVLSDSDIPWKTLTYVFAGTSFTFLLVTAWLIVDKISNKNKIIKSRRV